MRGAMQDRLSTFFPTEYGSALPIKVENRKFDQPKNQPHLMSWFKYLKSGRASIGTACRFNRHNGFFVVDCIVPEDSGSATVWKMSDAVYRIFDADQFTLPDGSVVTVSVPNVIGSGKLQDGFYIVTVMVPFVIDESPLS
jgi:hypothetical protein